MRTVTLQDLCLKVIVSKFKWYCEVYCSTEDSCLKLKFEFLKKRFSFLILRKLKEKGHIQPEWLDFLINKYLKVLDAEWLRLWPWETVCDRLAEIGANLEEVTFTRFDGSWEEVLCYFPNLKSVSFKDFCTDEFLLSLSKFCKYVETLDIKGSINVSDNGLKHLYIKGDDKNLRSFNAPIRELVISGTEVKHEDIVYVLKNMPSLEKIDYRGLPKVLYSMHKNDINAFDKVKPYNLTHLNLQFLNFHEFTNVFTVCAFVCPHLKLLSCPVFQKYHLDLFPQLQELEKLQLDCYAEDRLELNELLTLNGRKLTVLKIDNFFMSLSILAQNCPNLISLEISNVILQYNCNDSVPVFNNLEKVFMRHLVITEAVTCLLSSSPNLKQLCFIGCKLFFSEIKIQILRCCEQCALNVIDFSSSDVEFELIRDVLLTCSTLQILNLNKCDIISNYDAMDELRSLSISLPNKPQIYIGGSYDNDIYIISNDRYGYSNYYDKEFDFTNDYDDEDDEYEQDVVDDDDEDDYGYEIIVNKMSKDMMIMEM